MFISPAREGDLAWTEVLYTSSHPLETLSVLPEIQDAASQHTRWPSRHATPETPREFERQSVRVRRGERGGEGRRGRAPRVLLAQPPPQHWASPLPTHLSYYTKLPCCHHISAIVPAHCYRSVTISPLHLLLHLLLVLGDCFPPYFPRLTSLHHTLSLSLAFATLIPHSPHIMEKIITILQRCHPQTFYSNTSFNLAPEIRSQ